MNTDTDTHNNGSDIKSHPTDQTKKTKLAYWDHEKNPPHDPGRLRITLCLWVLKYTKKNRRKLKFYV